MTLQEIVRQKFEIAKRANHRVEKNLLSVILGDIATIEARTGKALTDGEVEKMLRDLLKHNGETLEHLHHARPDDAQIGILEQEIAFLKTILPETLDAAAIVKALEPVRAEIVSARNPGQATGVAVKHLKTLGLKALGQDVATAVQTMRG